MKEVGFEIVHSIYIDGQIIAAGAPINVKKIQCKMQSRIDLLE
jgi:hypothetical protein